MLADRMRMKRPAIGDPLWSTVKSLLHANGSSGSTAFTDATGLSWTAGGNAQISTAQSVFGGASASFDGAGDYIGASNPVLYSRDFTVEGRFRVNAINKSQIIFTTYNGASQANTIVIQFDSSNVLLCSNGLVNAAGTTTLSANTWYAFAAVYVHATTTLRIYLNGVLELTLVQPITNGAATMYYGGSPGDANIGTRWFDGYLDELRISWVARYTANYTIAAAPFPNF